MQISITGRHFEISDAIRAYVDSRIGAALGDLPKVINAHVILAVEKHRYIAEVVLHAPPHDHVEAKAEAEGMYAAIDLVSDKAGRQVQKLREKLTDHKGHEKLGSIEARNQEKKNQ